jgi:two-component system sensor histidine kinase DegS
MRGQLERLQSEQNHLAKFIGTLEKTRELIHSRIDVNRPRSILDANPVELAIDAQESLRQYLSLQMHDGPAQNLSNFMLRVDIANRLIDIDIVKAKEELANLKNEASKTFNNVKQYISELRPLSLDEHGLIPSIKKYIDGFSEKTGHEVSFSSQGHDERYKSYNEIMVYRAVQEILSDSHRNFHEQPEKLILSISLTLQPGKIILSVADNSGGSVKLLHQIEENHELGLFIKRLNLLGGSLNIEKTDEQTELIVFTIPVN